MKLQIEYDQDTESPMENCDGQWKLYSFNRRHGNFVDHHKYLKQSANGGDIEGATIGFARKLEVGTAFILSCYEHSGVQWGLQGETMQCRWDTAQVAGVLVWEHPVSEMGAKTYKDRQEDARKFLEVYNAWCNGETYWYKIEDEDDEDVDSCGGFIGDDLRQHLAEEHPELFNEDKKTLKEEVELCGDAASVLR